LAYHDFGFSCRHQKVLETKYLLNQIAFLIWPSNVKETQLEANGPLYRRGIRSESQAQAP